jgi:hypothetical protein
MKASLWRWRFVPLALALILAGVASVAYALGTASGAPDGAMAAQGTTIPGHPELGPGWTGGGALGGGALGGGALGGVSGRMAIAITKIDGSKLSLQTSDGWTRTIDTAGAAITKAGKTVTVSDLVVGDTITFRETRQTDGTYKITAIQVVMPTASGTVTAVTSGSVTISQGGNSTKTLTVTGSTTYKQGGAAASASALVVGVRITAQGTVDSAGNFTATTINISAAAVRGTVAGKTATTIVVTTSPGKTVTVNVSSSTKYVVRGVTAPTLSDVAAGAFVVASGTLNADGSLNATNVQAGFGGGPGFGGVGSGIPGGPGRGRWPSGGGTGTPGATTPGLGSNT